jgi:hypothetical protein
MRFLEVGSKEWAGLALLGMGFLRGADFSRLKPGVKWWVLWMFWTRRRVLVKLRLAGTFALPLLAFPFLEGGCAPVDTLGLVDIMIGSIYE